MAISESYAKLDSASASHHIPHKHHHIRRRQRQDVPSGDEDVGDEELDPRIQIELERLNRASEEINRLELELDDARAAFRQVLSDSTQCLNGLAKKLGTCIDKARPYYDAKLRLRETQLESQKAVLMFERSCSMHEAAKEMVQLAEEGYKRRECSLAPTWQEMLNHATMKVNEAERERAESEEYHQRVTLKFKNTQEELHRLQTDLKKVISKSKVYFDMKAKFNQVLEEQKNSVSRLEGDVGSAKALYAQALCSLEAISDDIHRHRLEQGQKLLLGVREAGVGAESPSPLQDWAKGMMIDGSASPSMVDGESNEDPINKCQDSPKMETILDVNQLRLCRHQAMIYFEPTTHRKTSPQERASKDGTLKSDPLDPVVFKTSLSDLQTLSCSQPTLNHHTQMDTVRSCTYQDAVGTPKEKSCRYPEEGRVDDRENSECRTIYPTSPSEPSLNVERCYQDFEDDAIRSQRKDLSLSELSRLQNVELSRADLSCAQEFVNTSKVVQQRISSSLSSPLTAASPAGYELPTSLAAHMGEIIAEGNTLLPGVSQERVVSIMTSVASQEKTSPTVLSAETSFVEHLDNCAKVMGKQLQLVSSAQPGAASLYNSRNILTTHILQHSPTQVQHSSTQIQHSRTQIQHTPTKVQQSLTQIQHSHTQVQHSPTTIQNSPPTQAQHSSTQILPSVFQYSPTRIQNSTFQHTLTTTQHLPTHVQLSTFQLCPTPVSHLTHRKPAKLQGLILQVGSDCASLSTNLSVHPSAYLHAQHNPKVLISTHHPMLGVFTENPAQPRPPV